MDSEDAKLEGKAEQRGLKKWEIGLENMSSSKGVDAESTGRDNDPRGLGDMPDSQGPSMVQSQLRDSVSGPHMSPPGVFPTALP